ncbi:14.7 kDa ribonuclease H-like protein [compost metagenome]
MSTAAELFEAAYNKEKSASRRLALRLNISTEAALEEVLLAAAGTGSLNDLLALRRQAKADIVAKTAERKQGKLAAQARKRAAAAPDPSAWLAWFDGACHPNPGKMAVGALLQSPQGQQTELSFVAGLGDSSLAEYLALISVLEAAIKAGADKLHIYGDSQVVINDVRLVCGGAAILSPQRLQAQQLLARLPQATLHWIPRHRNGLADALSQQAIRNALTAANPQLA